MSRLGGRVLSAGRGRGPSGASAATSPSADRRTSAGPARLTMHMALVTGAAVLVYGLAARNGLAYDDVPLVLDPRVRGLAHGLSDLRAILLQPYWTGAGHDLGLYRPLTTFSLAVDWTLSRGSTVWPHVANIGWHVIACLLVLLLLRRLFGELPALGGALVFAVHPVHVEAVAALAGRAELLAGVAVFAACLLWARPQQMVARSPRVPSPADPSQLPVGGPGSRAGPGPGVTVAVAGLYLLALASKESAVMLPGLLFLVDLALGRTPREGRSWRRYARDRAAVAMLLAAVLAAYLCLRLLVLRGLTPSSIYPAAEAVHGPGPRLLTALQAWPVYARLLFFPRVLLADYGPRVIMPAFGLTAAAAVGVLLLGGVVSAGTAAARVGRGRAALALLWFPLAVLPVSNLIVPIGVLVAERTLYVPSFALVAGVAIGLAAAVERSTVTRRTAEALLVLALAALAIRSAVRVPEWASTERVFQALLRDRPDAFRGHWFAARAARQRGDIARNVTEMEQAVRLWPYHERLLAEAAATELEADRPAAARTLARLAVQRGPDDPTSWRLLAASLLASGDSAEALATARRGLDLHPRDAVLQGMDRSLSAAGR
jgi:protein O-mannosyl-transferase